jgi:parallel beta-helix repeat protein
MNIGPCPRDGLVIGANGVVLNCAGHSISARARNTEAGINLAGISGVTVENCNITGFQYGFLLTDSSNNTLTGNGADGSASAGFFLDSSDNNTFMGNTANGNGEGFGLSSDVSGNTLSGNVANSNAEYGYIDTSTGSGTAGTANFYSGDECNGNGHGGSSPSGLGSPQS